MPTYYTRTSPNLPRIPQPPNFRIESSHFIFLFRFAPARVSMFTLRTYSRNEGPAPRAASSLVCYFPALLGRYRLCTPTARPHHTVYAHPLPAHTLPATCTTTPTLTSIPDDPSSRLPAHTHEDRVHRYNGYGCIVRHAPVTYAEAVASRVRVSDATVCSHPHPFPAQRVGPDAPAASHTTLHMACTLRRE